MNPKQLLLAWLLITLSATPLLAKDFTLQEHLGRSWKNELVTFALSSAQLNSVEKNWALVDVNGERVPYQLVIDADGESSHICFQTDLSPYESQSFRFVDQPARSSTTLQIEESDQEIRIENKLIGLAICKKLELCQGPISGIRLQSGQWTGGSALNNTAAVKSYSAQVTAQGPVFVEVQGRLTFSDGGTWALTCRIEDNEPVVIVEEKFDAPGGGIFQVHLGGEKYQPTHMLYRSGMGGSMGRVNSYALNEGRAFILEPWLHWWGSERQGNWFALYTDSLAPQKEPSFDSLIKDKKEDLVESLLGEDDKKSEPDANPDLLMIGLLKPSVWRDPKWSGKASHVSLNIPADFTNSVMKVSFPMGGGNRVWMFGTPDKDKSVSVLKEQDRNIAPLPQQYLIKHGDFPLNVVKEYVLQWEGDHENYPRLFVDKNELSKLSATLMADSFEVRRWEAGPPITAYNLDELLRVYFASNSVRLGSNIARTCEDWLSHSVQDGLLQQNSRVALGVAPHMQANQLLPTLNLTDVALGTERLTPEQRQRMLAQVALIGYAVNRDDYWSPARGFSANPNMTTTVAQFQVTVAALIPSHPMAKKWAERGLDTLTYQLNSWSDEDGGWLEAPHYAMVAYDHMLAAFIMAKRAGFADHLHDDRMRLIAEWFAKISTPPDKHTNGHRHYPPVGNTYYGESTGMFSIIAELWKERNPKFATQMQWMYQQHGEAGIGLGGAFPALAGYKELLKAKDVAPAEPDYGSQLFRETGVVLRSPLGSGRESYLYMIAGSNHDHYDVDSGSIVLWGKGRVLVDDWGYIGQHAQQYHSLMSSSSIGGNMRVKQFSTQPSLDYVSGRKGTWQRQIALVKDEALPDNNFFLIRDTHHADSTANWRLWLTSKPDLDKAQENAPSFPLAKKSKKTDDLLDDVLNDIETELESKSSEEKQVQKAPAPVTIHEQGVTVVGEDDVDFDLFIYQPNKLNLKTETVSQDMMVGRRDGEPGPLRLTQTSLSATLEPQGSIAVLVYPRVKTEPTPQVKWHAGGRIVEVRSKHGTDFVAISAVKNGDNPEEYQVPESGFTFRGEAGVAQLRPVHANLTLGEAGEIKLGSKVLASETPTTQKSSR